jgi:hypothetical protein
MFPQRNNPYRPITWADEWKVGGTQEISLLPKYVKQICWFRFLCNFALDNAGTENVSVLH